MKLLIAIILTLIFNSQTIMSQDSINSSSVVKVLTFNLYIGETTRGDFNLDVIANIILNADPDLVALCLSSNC